MADTVYPLIPPPPPLSASSSSIAPTGALCYPSFPHCLIVVPMLANAMMMGQHTEYQLEPKQAAPQPGTPAPAAAGQCGPGMHALFQGVSCNADLQCQALATGFFCYRGQCCAQNDPPPSGYGSACTLAEHCKFANSECHNNICYCRAGYGYNGQDCVLQGAYDPQPAGAMCAAGQLNINGRCYPYSGYGGFCDFIPPWSARQCNYPGGLCYQQRCVCPPGQLYNGQQCVPDPNIPTPNVFPATCPPGFVPINGQCLPLVGLGQPCQHDLQCVQTAGALQALCSGGACRYGTRAWDVTPAQRAFPLCRNPNAEVELSNTIPKDCIYQKCSPGYHCEWNQLYKGGQYICCGVGRENPIWGQPKMYPGHSFLPLQCTALNSCQFVDFPYCVYSESYRHKVCCSRPQCL